MKINWIKIKDIIPQIFAVVFIIFVIFYWPKLGKQQEDKGLPLSDADDQLITNLPDTNFHAYYWDFTKEHDNINEAMEEGFNKKNFLMVSDPQGSGEYVYSIKLFENGQLIFAKDFLYKGDAFFDNNNYLDIVYGVKGDTNCCPPAFILERYKYNSSTRQMDLLDKKEYSTKEISNDNGTTSTNSADLLDFINKNKAASFIY